jgi:endonuclease/exonuclease/phosphatase family metal-dependent hydrolase
MKSFALFAVFQLLVMRSIQSQYLNIASYNLRVDVPSDSMDRWVTRFPHIAGLVTLYDFDIFGTQEGLQHQLEDLKKALPGFDYIGVGREDGVSEGEYSAIFYKKEKFKLTNHGNFWLSQVTDRPNKGWDAACIRICTWGKFTELSTGTAFYVFNVHFDHMGEVARTESAKLMIEKLRAIAGNTPAILTGDFNMNETNPAYVLLNNSGIIKDVYQFAQTRYVPFNATFNGFSIAPNQEGRIDHIFVTRQFKAHKYSILTNTYAGHFPSDHFPVFVVLSY